MNALRTVIVILVLLVGRTVWAQSPNAISFQGVLQDSTGGAVADDTYEFTFRLYAATTGSDVLWEERQPIPVEGGLYQALLGTEVPMDLSFDEPYWLGVSVGTGSEMVPRLPLSAAPYSLRARSLDDGALRAGSNVSLVRDGDALVISAVGGESGGDITSVLVGAGLEGGGDEGDVSLAVAAEGINTDHLSDAAITTAKLGDQAVTGDKLADSTVTGSHVAAGQIVRSVNGLTDNIVLRAEGGATLSARGNTLVLSAGSGGGGTGIQGVQNTDNAIAIDEPNGPTATINLQAGGVDTQHLKDGSVTAHKLDDGAVTAQKLNDGTVLRGLQVASTVLRDDVTIQAGENVNVSADEASKTVTISAARSEGWSLSGNAGTNGDSDFIGTTDESPLELRVNGARAFAVLPASNPLNAPTLIGGFAENVAAENATGATISGGGRDGNANEVNAPYGVVAGGSGNRVLSEYGTVAGGSGNTTGNAPIPDLNGYATVGGGKDNTATGIGATVAGGGANTASGETSSIAGGTGNRATGALTAIGGGQNNDTDGSWASVPGGFDNDATGSYSFAAGFQAKAAHEGAFVWSDRSLTSPDDAFPSTGANQFLIRAAGGVGIGTNEPEWPLTVAGLVATTEGGYRFPDGSVQTTAAEDVSSLITTDVDTLILQLRGVRVLRVEPGEDADGNLAPSVISGSPSNSMNSGEIGGTIAGGGRSSSLTGFGPNRVSSFGSIGGGEANMAGAYASVTGGRANEASGSHSVIGGGIENIATGDGAVIAGGQNNSAPAPIATIGGGVSNEVVASLTTVAGGVNNVASGSSASIGGGQANKASGANATIGGGAQNDAVGDGAVVGGGIQNESGGRGAVIGGGIQNDAGGVGAAIAGGFRNEINGNYAAIPGGLSNRATGDYSLAAGKGAHADHRATFVWADTTESVFSSTADNQFLVRATGGVGINTNAPAGLLHVHGTAEDEVSIYGLDSVPHLHFRRTGNGADWILRHDGGRFHFQTEKAEGNEVLTIDSRKRVGIGTTTPSEALEVIGNVKANDVSTSSDARLKQRVEGIVGALDTIEKLRGVSFEWKRHSYPEKQLKDGRRFGFIAQEVRTVLPETVSEDGDGFYAVSYDQVIPFLVEAIKEQQRQIDALLKLTAGRQE